MSGSTGSTVTALNHLRASFGVARLSELWGRELPLAPEKAQREIEGAYIHLAETVKSPPPKAADQLRPVFFTSAVARADEAEVAARALLLCHSVAVILPNSINYPPRMLRLFGLLEDLIEKELVVILPEDVAHRPGSNYFEVAMNMDRTSADSPKPPGLRTAEEKGAASDNIEAQLGIAAGMDACARFPKDLDLALTSDMQLAKLRRLLEVVGSEGFEGGLTVDRLRFLPDLLALELPRLSMSVSELVKLRSEGLFDDWREALSEALRRIDQLDVAELLDPGAVQLRELRDHMLSAADRVGQDVRKSGVLRKSVVGLSGIGVASATGVLGALGGLEMAAIGGGVGAAGALVLDYLGGRPPSGQKEFRRLAIRLLGPVQ